MYVWGVLSICFSLAALQLVGVNNNDTNTGTYRGVTLHKGSYPEKHKTDIMSEVTIGVPFIR